MSIQYDPENKSTTSVPFSSGEEEAGLIDKKAEGGSFTNESVGEYATATSAASDAVVAKNAAETAETNAANSETNAATSAAAASTAETNAETAQAASETAKTAAETAETNAETAQTAAASSSTSASTSASTATTKASEASVSASSASTSASTATTKADTATTKATAASTSATDAATSATSAASSATTATSEASDASTSEANALTYKTAAETAKTASESAQASAETAETNAETSATAASGYASTATTQASTATTKASQASTSATAAASSASAASTSATAASTAKTAAELAETHAETAETNAETAETAAELAETHAETAETNAETAKVAAAASQASATASASSATASASSASTSASNASSSATDAQSSEDDAATSETNAAASATASATSATASASSATSASSSASTATTQANTATTKANTATTKATAAATSEANALTYKTAAETAKTAAETAETNAETAETNAETAETNSATSATASATSATASASSASSSATSATAAATSATNAASSLTTFQGQYVSQATAPSSPSTGDLWFDTTNDVMKVHDGSDFINAGSTVSGTENSVEYTATSGQTTFSATYDAGYLQVFLNGIRLDAADYTATNGSSVVLDTGATTGDTVFIHSFGTFALADHYNKTTTDTLLAAKVDDGQVLTNVPSGALFTDTTYSVGDGGLTQKNFTTADNTKLDGIETGATADQTNAEIRAAVEAATDSNAFTDADHSKLAGIATSANNYTLPSGIATETYVGTEISNLVDSSPAALNTLNELAAALGDDANHVTTMTNLIGAKLSTAGGTMTGDQSHGDNVKAKFGNSDDLVIFHDNAVPATYIKESGSGDLKISGNNLWLNDATGNTYFRAVNNSYAKMYHAGYEKLATTSSGVDISGTVTAVGGAASNNDDANIMTLNASEHARLLIDTSSTSGHRATLALESNGNETTLSNTGANSYLTADTGQLFLKSAASNVWLNGTECGMTNTDDTEYLIRATSNGSVKLYYDGVKKLETTSSGVDISGTVTADGLTVAGSDYQLRINQGSNQPYYIRHASDNSLRMHLNGTGDYVTIDSSGNVGIGVTPASYSNYNTLAHSGASGATFEQRVGSVLTGSLTADSQVTLNAVTAIPLVLKTNNTERMRISSAGELLVGKTTQGLTNAGFEVAPSGQTSITQSGASALRLNRLSSDGELLQLRASGSIVGSIGTTGGEMYIGSGDCALRFNDGGDQIRVSTSAGSNRDGAIDLGFTDSRFKDLHLSGAAKTDTIANEGSGTTTTSTTQTAIATFAKSDYDSAKVVISAKSGTDVYSTELLIVHNGTTASATEYGQIGTGSALATFDVDISGSNVRVLATAASSTSTVFKVTKTLL